MEEVRAILKAPNLTSRTGWLHQADNTQDVTLIAELQSKLLDLATLSPASRGLSFEHFRLLIKFPVSLAVL